MRARPAPAVGLRPVGDGALLVELGEPEPRTTALARALAERICAAHWPGIYDAVPAYRTVLVRFDPLRCSMAILRRRLGIVLPHLNTEREGQGRVVELPVLYGGEHGPDLQDVARHTGLPPEEVVRRHAGATYRVEFLGFSPGFPYLSGLPAELATPRLPSPRIRVPAGSVAIGGNQAGFYPLESPGGWRLIGRIPALRFDPARPETLPYHPGDLIRFRPIDASRFAALAAGDEPAPAPAGRGTGQAPAQLPARPGLRVVRAGTLSSVQDRGRLGLASLGYANAGALDSEALLLANLLVGNPPGAAAVELTLDGGEFLAERDLVIAVTGADLSPAVDGEPLPLWRAANLWAGSRLSFGTCRAGARAYLAMAGGVATPAVLGSRATDLVAGLGGLAGRVLRAGDLLPVGPPPVRSPGVAAPLAGGAMRAAEACGHGREAADSMWPGPAGSAVGFALPRHSVPRLGQLIEVRVIWGPQDDWFDEQTRAALLAGPFRASPRSDRTGLRLDGPALLPARKQDLASEGGVPGAIQVPPDGRPIVLLADGRGIGGYPKIATVISADVHRLAQAGPGVAVRFSPVSPVQAIRLAREARRRLRHPPLEPVPELGVRCLLEGRADLPGAGHCPRTLACLIARRCLAAPWALGDTSV